MVGISENPGESQEDGCTGRGRGRGRFRLVSVPSVPTLQ